MHAKIIKGTNEVQSQGGVCRQYYGGAEVKKMKKGTGLKGQRRAGLSGLDRFGSSLVRVQENRTGSESI